MSNKAHDHVHRLIRSMSRAEKRYFKLYTSRHVVSGHSNHQLLFDAIAAMVTYDEEALLRKFKGHAFVRRFPITKRRLYETILRSLDAFHAEGSLDARLHRMLHQVEILYDRALYEDARKMLVSVRRLAEQRDRHGVLLDVLRWERRMLERMNYAGTGHEDLDQILERSNTLHQAQMEEDLLWHLKSMAFLMLYQEGPPREKDRVRAMDALRAHPLLKNGAELRSPRARFLHHHVHAALGYASGDLESCLTHLQENRGLLDGHEGLFLDEPNLLFSVLSNLIYVTYRLGRAEEALAELKKFRRLPHMLPKEPSRDMAVKVFATGMSLELAILARSGEFEKAVELTSAVEEGLSQHGRFLSPLRISGLCFQMAYLHFGSGRLAEALKWSHRQLNLPGTDDGAGGQEHGRMLNLLIHLQLGHTDLLSYALRSFERHLKGHRKGGRTEEVFLAFMRARLKARDREQHRQALIQYRDALLALEKDPLERALLDHFDPCAWAESQLSGRTFAEVVKERSWRQADAA